MAITMFMVENWDRKESKVVIVPAPAIWNANGTIESSLPHHGKYEYLKSFRVPKEQTRTSKQMSSHQFY
jgi:hypothetical protein